MKKEGYSTFAAPGLLCRQLLLPLGLVISLFGFAFLIAADKTVTLFHVFLAAVMYFSMVLLQFLLYGKAYRRIFIDRGGMHTKRCSIRWEEIETYRLEDVTVRYHIPQRCCASVIGINCKEKDCFRSHTKACLYIPFDQKTLSAIRQYSQGRSDVMAEFIEKYTR